MEGSYYCGKFGLIGNSTAFALVCSFFAECCRLAGLMVALLVSLHHVIITLIFRSQHGTSVPNDALYTVLVHSALNCNKSMTKTSGCMNFMKLINTLLAPFVHEN